MEEEQGLFPVVDLPEWEEEEDAEPVRYGHSVFFDLESGDFRRDGAGRLLKATPQEAYQQWCTKAITTERYTCQAYPEEFGVELDAALEEGSQELVEARVEAEVTECLMANPQTESVESFEFTWEGGALYVSFLVKGIDEEEFWIEDFEIGIGG